MTPLTFLTSAYVLASLKIFFFFNEVTLHLLREICRSICKREEAACSVGSNPGSIAGGGGGVLPVARVPVLLADSASKGRGTK